jgi:DNA-binding transcriptional LysR family regulator
VRFKGLDLNLLVAFDALLGERSVTGAAERLHLSQPAISAALARLRDVLGDEILVAHGKRMVPTLLAMRLHGDIRDILETVDRTLLQPTTFDPASSHRTFVVGASDYIVTVLLAPLLRDLLGEAPGVRLRIVTLNVDTRAGIRSGDTDLMIAPTRFLVNDHPSQGLFHDSYVVVGWDKNPAMLAPMSTEQFLSHGQVTVEFGATREVVSTEQILARQFPKRRIEVVAPSFTQVAPLVVGTMRIGLIHRRLAEAQAAHLPIALAASPFPFAPEEERLQWHSTRDRDAGLVWLRQRLFSLALSGEMPAVR